ncbi:hypothetical protein FE783_09435 [Paenibacillus mesophilus]|nr:hypothetical protein FE783_09435 [Paenibacillus mesophilus]
MFGDRWKGFTTVQDGGIDFLRQDYIERACGAIRLPDEIAESIVQGAAAIRQDGALSESARRFHKELFIDKADPGEVNKRLLAAGPQSGMMAAVVYLGALPSMSAYYDSKRIPERVLVATLEDMAIWMRHYRQQNGEWGLGQVGWLIRHFSGKLFRLGRLQFAFIPYNKPFKAFRHRASGRVAALSESGIRYRADGQTDGTNGVFDSEGGWISALDFDGTAYTGHPVTGKEAVARTRVRLRADEWELVLEKGDTVLDVHIPEGGKMTHELCRDSYGQAVAFAADHFPETPFKGFVCSSWLLAPQFPLLLPADANIVRFQRDYYVTPVKSDEDQTLERVFGFGTKLADLPHVPRDTSLQRIVYDHLASGGCIHGAAGFLLKDDWSKGTTIAPEADIGT